MHRLRIVYLHQYFNTLDMIGGTRSYEMARRLVKAGHDLHMFTNDRSGEGHTVWRESVEAGIRVHWLGVRYSNDMRFLRRV